MLSPTASCYYLHCIVSYCIAGSGRDWCIVQSQGVRTGSGNDYSTERHSGLIVLIVCNIHRFSRKYLDYLHVTYNLPQVSSYLLNV